LCLRQLADLRDHDEEIRAAGATVVAISVDKPEVSEALRRQMNLPFAILCDTERNVVKAWDIYNPREKGGIAKPAAFIIGSDLTVHFVSLDTVAVRVPASEIVRILQGLQTAAPARRRIYIPTLTNIVQGLSNLRKFKPR
jgi:peroxiredoxin